MGRMLVDVTTMANYFGRVTGIARSEMQIAKSFAAASDYDVQYIFWSNDKSSFVPYDGPLDFEQVKAVRLGVDYSQTWRHQETAFAGAERLIVTGSSWLQNPAYTMGCLNLSQSLRLQTVFYIHDLIPVLFPHYYSSEYQKSFVQSLQLITRHAGALACNSENTQRDVLAWCAQQNIPQPLTSVAYLGDSFESAETAATMDLPEVLSRRDFVLAVGAIHRRKNYELLLAVWRRLQVRMGGRCPVLVIAGGVTQDGKHIANEIENDPQLRANVMILSGVDDAKLAALYKQAKLVAYPSHYEGWGLPVAEALAHGRVCLASNASAIPEIFDLGLDSIAPDDVPQWTSRILFYLQSEAARSAREQELQAQYHPRSWDDTVIGLDRLSRQARRPAAMTWYSGETVDFSKDTHISLLACRCEAAQEWGRWSKDAVARLRFELPNTENPAHMVLKLGLRSHCEHSISVRLNGHELTLLEAPQIGDLDVSVPLAKPRKAEGSAARLGQENLIEICAGPLSGIVGQGDTKPWHPATAGIGLRYASLTTEMMDDYDMRAGDRWHRQDQVRVSPAHSVLRSILSKQGESLAGNVRLLGPQKTAFGPDGRIFLQLETGLSGQQDETVTIWLKLHVGRGEQITIVDPRSHLVLHWAKGDFWGHAGVPVDVNRNALHEGIELIALNMERSRPAPCNLSQVLVPEALLTGLREFGPLPFIAEAGEYLKLGSDAPENQGLLREGWHTAGFGVEAGSISIMSFQLATNSPPLRRLRFKMKVINQPEAQLRLDVQGQQYLVTITDEIEEHIIQLPEVLCGEDVVSIAMAPLSGTSVSASNGSLNVRIVLRALHLLH